MSYSGKNMLEQLLANIEKDAKMMRHINNGINRSGKEARRLRRKANRKSK